MANKKVSELDALSNLQNDDLIEITKYMGSGLGDGGGDYKSYKMTMALFKLLDTSIKLGSITSSYTTGTTISLTALTIVNYVVIEVVSGTPTFKIGTTSGGAELMNETEALTGYNFIPIFAPLEPNGTIYPRITGAGTLKVTLILKQNLF